MEYSKIKSPVFIFTICIFTLLMSGCGFLWNIMNVGGFKSDINELARNQGVTLNQPSYHMVGTTRKGICTFTASQQDIALLVAGFNLVEYESNENDVRVYKTLNKRPPQLLLKNGRQFDYLNLYFNTRNGKATIQVSYAYG